VPGVQTLDEVIAIAEAVAGEKVVSLKRTVSVLTKFNNNIKSFDVQVCFGATKPPLEVYIVEDGPTCWQGDIDTPDYLELVEVGIEDHAVLPVIYPNPNNGIFYLNFEGKINHIKAYNILGKEIDVILEGNQINLNKHKSGMYVLHINELFIKTLIK